VYGGGVRHLALLLVLIAPSCAPKEKGEERGEVRPFGSAEIIDVDMDQRRYGYMQKMCEMEADARYDNLESVTFPRGVGITMYMDDDSFVVEAMAKLDNGYRSIWCRSSGPDFWLEDREQLRRERRQANESRE